MLAMGKKSVSEAQLGELSVHAYKDRGVGRASTEESSTPMDHKHKLGVSPPWSACLSSMCSGSQYGHENNIHSLVFFLPASCTSDIDQHGKTVFIWPSDRLFIWLLLQALQNR